LALSNKSNIRRTLFFSSDDHGCGISAKHIYIFSGKIFVLAYMPFSTFIAIYFYSYHTCQTELYYVDRNNRAWLIMLRLTKVVLNLKQINVNNFIPFSYLHVTFELCKVS